MIGHFPDPYPDELLYSTLARFRKRMRLRSNWAVATELFGDPQARASVELPCYLGALVSRLSPRHRYTVDRLIEANTLLPFYAPFLPPNRVLQLRHAMRGSNGGGIYGRLGVLTSKLRLRVLRFCPLCSADDERVYGERYWHRAHNLSGIDVCSVHRTFLEETHVTVWMGGSSRGFIAADDAITPVNARPLDAANPVDGFLLALAQGAQQLLAHRTSGIEQDVIKRCYLQLLARRGYGMPRGATKMTTLEEDLNAFYEAETLGHLHSSLDAQENWLRRLLHSVRSVCHPVRHLLLLQFLECPLAAFLELAERKEPLDVKAHTHLPPRGRRESPAQSIEANFDEKRLTYRKRWATMVTAHPTASRKSLMRMASAAYMWLRKHDLEWFETHTPPRLRPQGPPPRIDWPARDAGLAVAVRETAIKLRQTPGRPIRLCVATISRSLGIQAVVAKRRELVPLTMAALAEVVETVEDYAVRRIAWAAESARREGMTPTHWQLQHLAAVSGAMAARPRVAIAMRAASDRLRE